MGHRDPPQQCGVPSGTGGPPWRPWGSCLLTAPRSCHHGALGSQEEKGCLSQSPAGPPHFSLGSWLPRQAAAVGASIVTELAPASPPSASCGLLQDYREEIWGWVSLSGTCCCDFLSCCISIRLDTAPLSPLVALALRISSKITPPLPALQFPGARRCRGGGSSPCPVGVPTWASAPGCSPGGEGVPKVQSVRPQACAECRGGRAGTWHARPVPTGWPAWGGGGGHTGLPRLSSLLCPWSSYH